MTSDHQNRTVLVADVGGTNTRVALARGSALLDETVRRFRNADHASLEDVIGTYLAGLGDVPVRGASVAIAGPVRDGHGKLTNRDWSIDRATLSALTGARDVAVLNDLQAQGYALERIAPENLAPVSGGAQAPAQGTRLVIGVGTGFNAAPVYRTSSGVLVPPSEAGHAGLPVNSDEDLRLSRFARAEPGFAAVEDVLSGRGLERVYRWRGAEAGWTSCRPAADIIAACAGGTDGIAREAVAVFVRTLGAVAGDLALIHLPFGGLYLVGGVARAVLPHLGEFGFEDAFRDKGRFAGFMEQFPVQVVEDDFAGLTGLAAHLNG